MFFICVYISNTYPNSLMEFEYCSSSSDESPVTRLCDLNPNDMPEQHLQRGSDWVAIFNPEIPNALSIELLGTLDHASIVCCVRFSHDASYLATGCDRTAQIYDTATAQKISTFPHSSEAVYNTMYIRALCFSPDAKYLATGAEDKLIRIWDLATKSIVHIFQGHAADIYSLEFSSDGRSLVSGAADHTVQFWDMTTYRSLFSFKSNLPHTGITTVALSPDGTRVAAGSLDSLVRVWDVHQGHLLGELRGHLAIVYSIAFSTDGNTLFSASLDKTIKQWCLQTLGHATDVQCIQTLRGHKDFVLAVACSPCGKWMASGSKDSSVQFWDPVSGQQKMVLHGHPNSGKQTRDKLMC
ncbi:transcription repressor [Entomophthora muscae]|uniref:Transcription repressor n=1 Tax=Entomophthora muscae TaxID=34485 RepID=A0ACC2TTK7_9FUNG|nr:transcription repressor [Entomophthora muscae]